MKFLLLSSNRTLMHPPVILYLIPIYSIWLPSNDSKISRCPVAMDLLQIKRGYMVGLPTHAWARCFWRTFDQSLWSHRDRPPLEPDSFMHAAFPADVLLWHLFWNKLDNKTHNSIVIHEVKIWNFHKGSLKIIFYHILYVICDNGWLAASASHKINKYMKYLY